MEKQALIAGFVGQREALLQACWAHQLWKAPDLQTADGQPLRVVFPGWLNRGPGPDFTEARILLGQDEKFGDVEIHLEEKGWQAHGHHRDPAYERVVLHVVLRRRGDGGNGPAPLGKGLPVLEALPHLSPRVVEVMGEPEAMLRRYEELPGRCGLRAAISPPEALPRVIAHAAEARARQKAERLYPLWGRWGEEQILFQLIFQSLGYRPYAETFQTLAARFPLGDLTPLLALAPQESRLAVLSRWFGALGLLAGAPPPESDPSARAEFLKWKNHWEGLGEPPLAVPLARGGSRPWNSPERRMMGLFHHLQAAGPGSLLRGWLAFLYKLDGLRDQATFRKTALALLEGIFPTPPGEPWRHRVSFLAPPRPQAAKLVGADRLVIVMANAVLPFFLAYARRRGDGELEKLLYRLFIVLPPEAPNQRTRFMEKRLMAFATLPRTLRMHQGLLQIHQDFCRAFLEGCEGCRFPELIAPEK